MPFNYAFQKYSEAILRFSLLKTGDRVLVGFSGGADSTLLLTLLSKTEGITVAAAHLNHGIRGDEAERDERFCKEFCEKNQIKLFISHANVPEIAKETSKTVEEAARDARYSFFDQISRENGYTAIATAHNADDSLETAIFHLARGTSLDGLCGIPPKRDNVIRPLILLSKEEVVTALNDRGISFVFDSTNDDDDYTRNRIRHKVIPHLKELNPSLIKTFNSSLDLLRRDRDCLDELSQGHSLKDGRSHLSSLHESILSRVLLRELHSMGATPERKHVDMMISAIKTDAPHVSLSLPKVTFICDRDTVYIKEENDESILPFRFSLKEGLNMISENKAIYVGNCEKDINSLKNIYKLSIHTAISSAKINSDTVIRSRQSADTIKQGGMTRRVKKLIQSLKLPSTYTDTLPFIETDGELVYIPHFPPCDSAKPQGNSDLINVYYFYNL